MSAIAEHLKRVGWIKGRMYDYGPDHELPQVDAACCLYGALVVVDPGFELIEAVQTTIQEQYSDRLGPGATIPLFNDHQDTTFEDVLSVLEKVQVQT